ncbi:DUF6082 family protein [Paractinoplanes maris]|uniref:DUF6082 family protein n=1 Tax=Paractinoplanes maris TaxID=1734446 RepID=UPI00201FFC90|nr:DUF6082 family protein [Actinoplanes maris]
MSDDSPGGRSLAYTKATLWIVGLVLLVSAGAVLAGIGLVAVLARNGDDVTWSRWSSVGEAFGAVNSLISVLAVAAVVVTWTSQYRLLREQRAEVAEQRLMEERRADLELRKMHVDLMRMALERPHLAEVWPRIAGADALVESQHMYANLILQHVWLEYSSGQSSHDQMVNNVRYLMASPAMRAFWRDTENNRRSIYAENTEQSELIAVTHEIWRQCEAVLACSTVPESTRSKRGRTVEDLNGSNWRAMPGSHASEPSATPSRPIPPAFPPEPAAEPSSPPA